MSTADVIQVDLASDTSEGEKAADVLKQLATKAYLLDDQLRQGTISFDKYNAELEKISGQATRVATTFDTTVSVVAALDQALQANRAATMQEALRSVNDAAHALDAEFAQGKIGLDEYNARFQSVSAQTKKLGADFASTAHSTAQVTNAFGQVDAVARYAEALEQARVEAHKLDLEFATGKIIADEYAARFRNVSAQAAQMASGVNAAAQAVQTAGAQVAGIAAPLGAAGAALDTAGAKAKVNGQQFINLGRLIDDLQYVPQQGLRPIINNVMEMAPAIGIALIAVQTLYNNWDSLAGLFGMGAVKTQAQEMEELRKKTSLTADEAERLARASRGEKATNDYRAARPEAEKKADQAALKAIGDAGGADAVNAGIRVNGAAFVEQQPLVVEAQKKLDQWEEEKKTAEALYGKDTFLYGLTGLDGKIAQAKSDLQTARERTVEAIGKGAIEGQDTPGGRARLADLIRKNPAAFGEKGKTLLEDLDTIGAGEDPTTKRKAAADAQKKAETDADHQHEADIRKAEQDAAKKTADYYKRVGELAQPLQNRFNRTAATEGSDDAVSRDEIREELANAGVSEADAERFAQSVLGELQDKFNEELRKRASKKGVSLAEANDAILVDAQQKENDEARKKERQAGQEGRDQDAVLNSARQSAEKAERDRADGLKRATAGTGRDDRTRMALMRDQLNGMDPERSAERVAAELARQAKANGMDGADADRAAREYVEEKRNELADEVLKRGPGGSGDRADRGAERVGTGEFARSVEAAGQDEAKKMVSLQERMLAALTQIQQQGPRGAFGP